MYFKDKDNDGALVYHKEMIDTNEIHDFRPLKEIFLIWRLNCYAYVAREGQIYRQF